MSRRGEERKGKVRQFCGREKCEKEKECEKEREKRKKSEKG